MPKDLLFYEASGMSGSRKVSILTISAASVLLIIVGIWLVRFPPWAPELFSYIEAKTPTVESYATGITQTIVIPTTAPSFESNATTLQPTLTSTPVLPHLIETPFGLENKLVVHQVQAGETLTQLAATYDTTVEAIQAINVITYKYMMINSLLVIPVGQTDVSAFPQFQAILITKEDTTFEELAAQNSVDLALLSQINLLPENYSFQIGEWVLIPAAQKTP